MKTLVLLAAAALAAAPAPSRTAGTVLKTEAGRLTIIDDAGHTEQFRVTSKTRVICDGKKAAFPSAVSDTACSRAAKVLYNAQTKAVSVLELTTQKVDADDKKGRALVSGEIALTDVMTGKLSVRTAGGATVDFTVPDGAKIVREIAGGAAEPVAFESLKVGDPVEVLTKDSKTVQEIHVRAPAP